MKSEARKKYLKERRAKVCDCCGGPREIAGYCQGCWQKRTERRKALFAEKKQRGECITCTNLSIEGKCHCDICLLKIRSRRKNREDKRRQDGVCVRCGKEKGGANSGMCPLCYAKETSVFHFGSVNRASELVALLKSQGSRCPYSGEELILGDNTSLDHVVPRSRGGSDEIENLQWLYSRNVFDVNRMKWDMTDKEFRDSIIKLADFLRGSK